MHTQNKSTAAGHTAGAERAARRISACFPGPKPSDDLIAEFVETINDETGHAELLEALESALAYLETVRPKGKIRDIFHQLNQYENGVMKPARAAIARAKGVQS